MKCPSCQKENPPEMKFCVECGNEFFIQNNSPQLSGQVNSLGHSNCYPETSRQISGAVFDRGRKWWQIGLWIGVVGFAFFAAALWNELRRTPDWQQQQEWLADYILGEKIGMVVFGIVVVICWLKSRPK
jgi:hypothetical protein